MPLLHVFSLLPPLELVPFEPAVEALPAFFATLEVIALVAYHKLHSACISTTSGPIFTN